MKPKNILVKKIQDRRAIIGVIGLGYVGLPLAIRFGEERYPAIEIIKLLQAKGANVF